MARVAKEGKKLTRKHNKRPSNVLDDPRLSFTPKWLKPPFKESPVDRVKIFRKLYQESIPGYEAMVANALAEKILKHII